MGAVPKPGWAFKRWSDENGDLVFPYAFYTFDMTTNFTFKAEFVPAEVTLDMAVVGNGYIGPGAGRHYYLLNDPLSVAAMSGNGDCFSYWLETGGDNLFSVYPWVNIVMDRSRSITGYFGSCTSVLLNILVAGQGSVSMGGNHVPPPIALVEIDPDETVTLTAVPQDGWFFIRWEGNVTEQQASSSSITLTMDTSKTVMAEFEPCETPPSIVSTNTGFAPLTVQFTGATTSGCSPVTAWAWDFGDGGTSTEPDPSHTYVRAGTYNVSLAVTTTVSTQTETEVGSITVQPNHTPLTFADPNLAAAICTALGKATGSTIYEDDVVGNNFTALPAHYCGIQNLGGIEACQDLHYLDVTFNPIWNLVPLASLHNLRDLYVEGSHLSSIAPLTQMPHLRWLGVYNTAEPVPGVSNVTDWSPLQDLTELESLILVNDNLSNCSFVSAMPNLWDVVLDNNPIDSISPLTGHDLVSFSANSCLLTSILALDGMDHLQAVYLDDNNLTNVDELAGKQDLYTVSISGNLVGDLTSLQDVPQLMCLYANSTGISSLQPLSNKSNLWVLSVKENSLNDLNSLTYLQDKAQLAYLYLGGNAIENLSPLTGLTELRHLGLENNDIEDLSALVSNDGLGDTDWIELDGNSLSDDAKCGQVYMLRERGVLVTGVPNNGGCQSFTLTTQVEGDGRVIRQPDAASYIQGMWVRLTATPLNSASHRFYHWEEGGLIETANPITITMNGNKTVKAVFTDYTLNVEVDGNGTVMPGVGTHYYMSGQVVNFSVSPADGWMLDHWEGDLNGADHNPQLTISKNHRVKAVFTQGSLKAAFKAAPTSGSVGVTVQFTDQSAWGDTQITNWEWNFGDGSDHGTGSIASHTYGQAGLYTVSLKVTADTHTNTETKSSYVSVVPVAVFTKTMPEANTAPCSVSFANQTALGTLTSAQYLWTFGDGGTSNLANPVHIYRTAGDYTVSLKVTTAAGPSSAQQTVTIAPPPNAQFSATPRIGSKGTSGLSVAFAAEATGAPVGTWAWDFGDGTQISGTESSPQHTYTDAGCYSVSLTVTTANGTNKETKARYITVQDPNTASVLFSADPSVGTGTPRTVTFSALAGGLELNEVVDTWTWDFGDGETGSGQNPTHVYQQTGVYTVTLSVTTKIDSVYNRTLQHTQRDCVRVLAAAIEPQPEGSFGKAYEDLVPPDTAVAVYDPDRFAVITGRVNTPDGASGVQYLPNVRVSILGKQEYGSALTDAEGRFSLPVDGGGDITVLYEADGYISSQRRVTVPWNEVAIAGAVTLIHASSSATEFDLTSPQTQFTHTSTPETDAAGTRACTAVFSKDNGNEAYEVDVNGNKIRTLTKFNVRATEYKTEASMPSVLPSTSAYTYCVELNVDGAERVAFKNPVVVYVDNFLGFPTGSIVPLGSYDRDEGVWKPEKDGVVVQVVSLKDENDDPIYIDGVLQLGLDKDREGDAGYGYADDFNGDSQVGDEIAALLASRPSVQVGDTFWRVEVSHFSPWDCNWPGSYPPDAIPLTSPPPIDTVTGNTPPAKVPLACYVTHQEQAYHDDVPIPGTTTTLHYASDNSSSYKRVVRVKSPAADAYTKRVEVVLTVNGKVYTKSWDGPWGEHTPELGVGESATATFAIDESDAERQRGHGCWVNGSVVGKKVYDTRYRTWEKRWVPSAWSFGNTSDFFEWVPVLVRTEVTYDTPVTSTGPLYVGRLQGSIANGWTLSDQCVLPSLEVPYIIRGDGERIPVSMPVNAATLADRGKSHALSATG